MSEPASGQTQARAHLTALAESATPGPWRWGTGEENDGDWGRNVLVTVEEFPTRYVGPLSKVILILREDTGHDDDMAADAAYIAAVSPDVVLGLLADLAAAERREEQLREALAPTAETRDYLRRTIATIRNHRDADNCWPQWANRLADEVERMWGALADVGGEQQGEEGRT